MEAASDPAPGSVRPKAKTISPLDNSGKYFFFCSSEPNFNSGAAYKELFPEM